MSIFNGVKVEITTQFNNITVPIDKDSLISSLENWHNKFSFAHCRERLQGKRLPHIQYAMA